MKKIKLLLAFGFFVNMLSGQERYNEQIDTIEVSDIKTTHLILKEKIKYIDIGSRYFVTDTLENIIKIKHVGGSYTKKKEHINTNITFLTTSGFYHSIPLKYNRSVSKTTVLLNQQGYKVKSKSSIEKKKNDLELYDLCQAAIPKVGRFNFKANTDLLLTRVNGIFYKKNHLIMRVTIKNFSTIDFDVDQILFRLVRKKKFAKNAVYQERILYPIKECNLNTKVTGNGGIQVYNFIFDKFTPNKKEELEINVMEKNGGRSSRIRIPRKLVLAPDNI